LIDKFASRTNPTIKKLRSISFAAAEWLLNFADFVRLRKRILTHEEDEGLLTLQSARFRRFTARFVTVALVGSLIASFIASKAAGHLYDALYAWLTHERSATLAEINKVPPIGYDELKKVALHLGDTDGVRELLRAKQEHNALALTVGQFIETSALSVSLANFWLSILPAVCGQGNEISIQESAFRRNDHACVFVLTRACNTVLRVQSNV
jgi:hypothetical protein